MINQPGNMEWSHFSIKILGTNFGNSILDNFNWDKISESIAKKLKKEEFFIQLLNAWLHFTNNNFPTVTSIEKILDQPLFSN